MIQQQQQQQQPLLQPQQQPFQPLQMVPVSSVTQEHWNTVLSDFRRSVSNLVLFMLEAIPMPWVFPMQSMMPPADAEAPPPDDHFEDSWMCFAPETAPAAASRPPSPEVEPGPEAKPLAPPEDVNEKPKSKRGPRKKKADVAALDDAAHAAVC